MIFYNFIHFTDILIKDKIFFCVKKNQKSSLFLLKSWLSTISFISHSTNYTFYRVNYKIKNILDKKKSNMFLCKSWFSTIFSCKSSIYIKSFSPLFIYLFYTAPMDDSSLLRNKLFKKKKRTNIVHKTAV